MSNFINTCFINAHQDIKYFFSQLKGWPTGKGYSKKMVVKLHPSLLPSLSLALPLSLSPSLISLWSFSSELRLPWGLATRRYVGRSPSPWSGPHMTRSGSRHCTSSWQTPNTLSVKCTRPCRAYAGTPISKSFWAIICVLINTNLTLFHLNVVRIKVRPT